MEESAESVVAEEGASDAVTGQAEAEPEEKAEVVQEQEPAKEPIPAELQGLSEDVAREAMEEAKRMQEPSPEGRNETGHEETEDTKGKPIPYPRWVQKLEENNSLKEKLKAYEERFGNLDAVKGGQKTAAQATPSQMPTPQTPVQQGMQIPEIQLTPEVMQQIGEYTKEQALKMTGMSKEDVDGLEFMEDGDQRKQQYQYALRLAESEVFGRIQQARQAQLARAQEFIRQHNASASSYQNFEQHEMAEPDFKEVQSFARDAYFSGLPQTDQSIVREAYNRVVTNAASPQDFLLVKNYYSQAKAAYRMQHPLQAANAKKDPMQKVKEAQKFPRAQQVSGSGDAGGGMSVASLEKLLDTTADFKDLPPHIQEMLKGL